MKKLSACAGVLAVTAMAVILSAPAAGSTTATASFERLKALEGRWEARDDKGEVKARISYEPVAGGSSLLEKIEPTEEGHATMISVYHMDGDALVMTHYCMAGNQPTMRASGGGDQLVFKMTGAANLAKATDGHMHGLRVLFKDPDHFTQEWLWTANGKEEPHVFEYARVRN